jgi:4-hydroxybenzoyl-CoA reductase subunit beta
MIALPAFRLMRPATLAEAACLAAEPDARLIAGGTGLPNLRLGLGKPRTLVSLDRLEELRGIDHSNSHLRIGAGVTLGELARCKDVPDALREAAKSVAAPGHRSAATLGGNLCLDTRCVYYNQSEHWRRSNDYCLKYGGETCHVAPQGKKCRAAYSGDLAPALLALEAQVETTARVIPLEELYRDDGAAHLALGAGEIVSAVRIPAPKGRTGYAKARGRGSIDYPLAGVAMVLDLKNGQIAGLRVALTGTNSRPFVLTEPMPSSARSPMSCASRNCTENRRGRCAPRRR